MKLRLIILLSIFPILLFSQKNYEKEGDALFEQGQYEKAIKKYRAAEAVAELNNQPIPAQLADKLQQCIDFSKPVCEEVKQDIQLILTRLSRNVSKSGDQSELSEFFTENVNPYVSVGTSRMSKDIPLTTQEYLDRFQYYEVSAPDSLEIKTSREGYIAIYNVIVEWYSERTGRKKACVQKTTYLNKDYLIEGYTDKELWRENE